MTESTAEAMAPERIVIAKAQGRLGQKYQVEIQAGAHHILADEALAVGGTGEGPAPYDLLLASLAACTAITLRMYAEHKGWPLEGLFVELKFSRFEHEGRIDRTLVLEGPLTQEQRLRFAEIAERRPAAGSGWTAQLLRSCASTRRSRSVFSTAIIGSLRTKRA
jgi:putative redox protein